jgi:hypothetical protein
MPEQLAVQAGSTEIMQETGDLITFDKRRRIPEPLRDRCAHPGSTDRMRPVIPTNDPATAARIADIVQLK